MNVRTLHFGELSHMRTAPPEHQAAALQLLTVAELVRARWGPLRVTSGYRPQDTDSQHSRGEAVDLVPVKVDRLKVARWLWLLDRYDQVRLFDQVCVYSDTTHLHLSWSSSKPQRGELLVGVPSSSPGRRWDYHRVAGHDYGGPLAFELGLSSVSGDP